jgi:hypothetical protein
MSHISFIGNTAGPNSWGNGVIFYDTARGVVIGNEISDVACNGLAVSLHDDGNVLSPDILVADNVVTGCGRAATFPAFAGSGPAGYQYGCGALIRSAKRVVVRGDMRKVLTARRSIVYDGSSPVSRLCPPRRICHLEADRQGAIRSCRSTPRIWTTESGQSASSRLRCFPRHEADTTSFALPATASPISSGRPAPASTFVNAGGSRLILF